MNPDVIVQMEDLRRLRYCSRGIRKWFADHGLDYTLFLKEGMPGRVLLEASNNDALAEAAVEVANGRR